MSKVSITGVACVKGLDKLLYMGHVQRKRAFR